MTAQLARKIHLLLATCRPACCNCSTCRRMVQTTAAMFNFLLKMALRSRPPTRAELASAEVLVTTAPLLGSTLYSLPRLQWAQLTFAGVEKLMQFYQPDKPAPPFAVTRMASTAFSRELAEWVLAAVLGHERGFGRLWAAQRRRAWTQSTYTYRPVSELTIGVLGTGQMGREVGLLFKKLGCTVNGLSRTEKTADDAFDNMFTSDHLSEFLRSADYLCSVLPSTPSTRHLLTAARLADLPRRPVLVNAGRGDLITERELVAALRVGSLSGAVLDVFENRAAAGRTANSGTWSRWVTISPHVANLSRPELVCAAFLENLERFTGGRPLLHRVEWDRGY
ncbi:Glyoxylate/hydroxypyruvate reductase A [Amphibalanus amphitrite]|uniref:Glyoxylate/hydroxypyruvate reductase A n=1 Tax=Amphibalanus amphitrite TaxID=1232801 RepID=A0A6A4XDF0_AMPAM|nr:Glyoxylate/hydroxypyruvate reductase A [Amphibalanus amphitrite]